jgi:serine/threonine-protein kinase
VTIGEVVAAKYRVERLVGEGGMGVVVAARHVQLDTVVALKLLPESSTADPVLVERFLREARSAAKLRSDHVAKVLDYGTLESGAPFMVMEYLEGATLADVLASHGSLEPATACGYVLQACEAVAEAHSLGIVHRDLKPENLYLTKRVGGADFVKVIDFGVSKTTAIAGSLTTTKTVVGSPMYMAPEQMRSSRVADPRSDVWALGVVLYELLTERCPFEGESLPELCLKISREPYRPLAELRPGLPRELLAIIARCLQKDPAHRYANAAELAEALEPLAPGATSVEARSARRVIDSLSETVAESAAPQPVPPRRRRTASFVAVLVGTALVVGVWTDTRPVSGKPGLALAAVDAVRSASFFTQDQSTPETLAPLPAATAAAAASGPTPTSAPPKRTMMMRPSRTSSSPGTRGDDDIPAYR